MSIKYYTIREVAQLLRLDKTTIYKWIKSGKIKAIKINNRWLIPAEEVERIVKRKI